MVPFFTGMAAGALHVFSGVDHLAALAPIAAERPAKAGRIGAWWGFGHGTGVLVIGGLGLALRELIDIEVWSQWAEFAVGWLLLAVGVWAVWRSRTLEIHSHSHEHEGDPHEHLHAHDGHRHEHAALGVGALHGMAGSGHLFGVLPALALPVGQAIVYLVAYLVAAVAAMSGFAALLGKLIRRGDTSTIRWAMAISGVVAFVVGIYWIVGSWPG